MSEPLYRRLLELLADGEEHSLRSLARALSSDDVLRAAALLKSHDYDVHWRHELDGGRRKVVLWLGGQERLFGRDAA